MSSPLSPSDPTLSTIAIASWETNATHWDATITRHGNIYWRRLQEPCLTRLLSPTLSRPGGCRALDLATGNGLCARWLLAQGATEVVAADASEGMLKVARWHCEGMERVRFRRVDVTDKGALERLGEEEGRFGVVLMNMAAMDVAEVETLAGALRGLLEEGGVFVATLLHPVFFTSGASRNVELKDNPVTGERDVSRSITVRDYMSVPPALGWAVPGQPAKQVYFHRPMHELFATFFSAGMVMDAMEELAFSEEDAEERLESTRNFTQLPVILAFRMWFP